MYRLVEVRSKRPPDGSSKLSVLCGSLLLAEDFEGVVDSLGGGDFGIVKMSCHEDFPPGCFLVDACRRTPDFERYVGGSWARFSSFSSLCSSESSKSGVSGSSFLPGEVRALDVFFKFGLFCFERGQLGKGYVGDAILGDGRGVVGESGAEGPEVLDGAEAPLAGDEGVGVASDAQDDGVEEALCLDRVREGVERCRIELAALAIGGDQDGGYVDELRHGEGPCGEGG